ncbi:MAG TPA: hypothetical protein VFW90_00960 [Candidatus Saccharimonadales bacterium]|nr:hypothetical protein [Candidatus Saccharimonadales bacterium]
MKKRPNFERVILGEESQIRNPDEVVWDYASMLSNFLSHSKPNLADIRNPEYWGAVRWMAGQIHDMIGVSRQSSFACRYKTGMERIFGRGFYDDHMYGREEIDEYSLFTLEDVVYSDASDDFSEDMIPGFPDSRQLYFLDPGQHIALSANQTLRGLFAGGSISPYPRGAESG